MKLIHRNVRHYITYGYSILTPAEFEFFRTWFVGYDQYGLKYDSYIEDANYELVVPVQLFNILKSTGMINMTVRGSSWDTHKFHVGYVYKLRNRAIRRQCEFKNKDIEGHLYIKYFKNVGIFQIDKSFCF